MAIYVHTQIIFPIMYKISSSYIIFIMILGLNYVQGSKIFNCVILSRGKIVLFKEI